MNQHLERGKLLLQQHRHREAEAEFKMHLSLEPNDDEAHLYLALCYLHGNKLDDATISIQQSIALFPHNAFAFYIYSRILFGQEKYKESRQKIDEAINIQPMDANFFAWSAQLHLFNKDYLQALEAANAGLANEPDNIDCLNQRTMALVKLDKKEEAYSTINDALLEDPENSLTHANTGWAMLEHGDHKKALIHFTESLRLNPNNEWAKHGMIEALKARYFIYRMFLKYMFWIGNLKGNKQWMIIIGAYILVRILNNVAETKPQYEPFIMPVVIAYAVFALSTWVLMPLFNVLLLLHPQGRYALSPTEKSTSVLVFASLVTGLISLLWYTLTGIDGFLFLAILGLSMMIPISGMQLHRTPKQKKILTVYTFVLLALGLITVALAFMGRDYLVTGTIYAVMMLMYQFLSNSFIIR